MRYERFTMETGAFKATWRHQHQRAYGVTSIRHASEAIRWTSDRIGKSGVIGILSGSGFVEKHTMDGTQIYIDLFQLRVTVSILV